MAPLKHWSSFIVAFIVSTVRSATSASAFASSSMSPMRPTTKRDGLRMSNFFDDMGYFFSNMMGGKNNNDDDDYLGSTRLVELSGANVKPGGLRLFLMLYLMGVQNTPDHRSWSVDQPTGEIYAIDCYYHDKTAVLMIRLTNNTITIDRFGSKPSMSYMMQESVIVSGILDELSTCAFDDNVVDKDRLLQLPDPKDAIEKVRETLAFG
jgi:hypothetical protein